MAGEITGIILAGGANTRFKGLIKSKLIIGGQTIISRIIDTIHDIFREIIIITNTPEEFSEYKYKTAGDHFVKAGPLGGIHAALKTSMNEAVFVFAGDMPFLDKSLIIEQIHAYDTGNYEIFAPRINEKIEPLHAIYNKSILNKLEDYLANNRSYAVRDFLELINAGYMQLEETERTTKAFLNINRPSDISVVEQMLKIGSS
jgi:molybdenum cofactor guanylyltransferase